MQNEAGKVYKGRPDFNIKSSQRSIALLVNQTPTDEDEKALTALGELAEVVKKSSVGEYFVLSVHRLSPEEAAEYAVMPRLALTDPPVKGAQVCAYLVQETEDISRYFQ